jgi:hypothetical protein
VVEARIKPELPSGLCEFLNGQNKEGERELKGAKGKNQCQIATIQIAPLFETY